MNRQTSNRFAALFTSLAVIEIAAVCMCWEWYRGRALTFALFAVIAVTFAVIAWRHGRRAP